MARCATFWHFHGILRNISHLTIWHQCLDISDPWDWRHELWYRARYITTKSAASMWSLHGSAEWHISNGTYVALSMHPILTICCMIPIRYNFPHKNRKPTSRHDPTHGYCPTYWYSKQIDCYCNQGWKCHACINCF